MKTAKDSRREPLDSAGKFKPDICSGAGISGRVTDELKTTAPFGPSGRTHGDHASVEHQLNEWAREGAKQRDGFNAPGTEQLRVDPRTKTVAGDGHDGIHGGGEARSTVNQSYRARGGGWRGHGGRGAHPEHVGEDGVGGGGLPATNSSATSAAGAREEAGGDGGPQLPWSIPCT